MNYAGAVNDRADRDDVAASAFQWDGRVQPPWCIRNFSAARHNATVNRHRQSALSTFEAFVQAAGGDQRPRTVLLQATQSIFAPQASGYLKTESEAPGGPMIEIVRNLTPHKE